MERFPYAIPIQLVMMNKISFNFVRRRKKRLTTTNDRNNKKYFPV